MQIRTQTQDFYYRKVSSMNSVAEETNGYFLTFQTLLCAYALCLLKSWGFKFLIPHSDFPTLSPALPI